MINDYFAAIVEQFQSVPRDGFAIHHEMTVAESNGSDRMVASAEENDGKPNPKDREND